MRPAVAAFLGLGALALAGCANRGAYHNVPEQRTLLPPWDLDAAPHFLVMSQPNLDRFVLRDIHPAEGGAPWRWTGQKPAVRLRIPLREGFVARADFVTARESFSHTGPLTARLWLNGCVLAEAFCQSEREYRLEKPAPPACLAREGEQHLSLELDKVHREPGGRALGVILLRMGFTD
jgi:hypothetical protein